MSWLRAHRYLLARRACQLGILGLFALGADLGALTGNLSAARVLGWIPLADPYATLQILATGHALPPTALVAAGLVVAFYFAVGGRAFCSWVCPLNPVTDLARALARRLGGPSRFRVERGARYWVAGLALAVSGIAGVAAFEAVSPIGMLHRELLYGAGLGLLAVGGILLADLWVLRHGWCGSLCPLGAFYSLVGRWSPLRVGFRAARCDRCGDCVQVCPEPQVIRFADMEAKGFVDSGNCTNCARCLDVCPRDAFGFALRFRPPIEAAG